MFIFFNKKIFAMAMPDANADAYVEIFKWSFMHHVVKWPNILQKSCGVNTARILKYVWPFYNMHERVKTFRKNNNKGTKIKRNDKYSTKQSCVG